MAGLLFRPKTWGNTSGEWGIKPGRLKENCPYIWTDFCLNKVKGCIQPIVSVGNC